MLPTGQGDHGATDGISRMLNPGIHLQLSEEWDVHMVLYINSISDDLFYTGSALSPNGENMALGGQPHPPVAASVGEGGCGE